MANGSDRLQLGRELGEMFVDDEDPHPGVGQRIGDFRLRPARVDRHDDAARPRHGVEGLEVVIGVQRDDGDPVAIREPLLLEHARVARDPIGEFPPVAAAARA